MKKNVAVLFGGRSAEHEVSVITALQAISAIDTLKYRVIPIYIDASGKWHTGEALLQKQFYSNLPRTLSDVQQVLLSTDPQNCGIIPLSRSGKARVEKTIPVDVYFLAFHGQYGENGAVQGALEMADAAYTGCGILASAAAVNKSTCKALMKHVGIPVLPSVVVRRHEPIADLNAVHKKILSQPGLADFPLFVKPNNLGSSVGISAAYQLNELNASLAKVFKYDDEALIEPCVTHLLEINVAVLGGSSPRASVVEIPVASGSSLTFEDKYMRKGGKKSGESQGMAGLTRIINPPDLAATIKRQVIDYALKGFEALQCSGVGRFDFIYDTASERLYFNELNPIPGSLAFYLWEKSEPPILYTHIIDNMITEALDRKAKLLCLQTSYEKGLLKV